MTDLSKPFAWVIGRDNNANDKGFIDAMAWSEGEFTTPVYLAPQPLAVAQTSPEREAAVCARCGGAGFLEAVRCPNCSGVGWTIDEPKGCPTPRACSCPSAQRAPIQEALELAVNIIMASEPGDSRGVSNEAVALAAVSIGDTSAPVMKVIRNALALTSTEGK